ncbi:MAG: dihydropteroate synthase [Prevotella sp.]|nr:dihydropteroate synthase [Prevotella sp.]
MSINIGGRLIDLAEPVVMGILNCTPDSFFSGSRKQTEREIAERAQQIVAEGGRMIDVGAFSTRPGADEVPIDEELRRLQTALQIVRREVPDAIVSVDTYRPLVARRCVEEWGADIVNDVSEGGRTGIVGVAIHEEESMFATVAQLGVPYILMSVQPTIETMLKSWADDVLQLRELGQKDIILDPGFGFGKTVDENYAVMGEMEKLAVMELPLLVGVSRKSMIWKLLDGDPETALNGTTALNAIALLKGAKILRVHDVKEAVETVKIVGKCSPLPTSPNRGRRKPPPDLPQLGEEYIVKL